MVETKEFISNQIELTSTQRAAADLVFEAFEADKKQNIIVALNGFDGIGKSTVEEQIKDKLSFTKVACIPFNETWKIRDNHLHKCFVTTAGNEMASLKDIAKENLQKHQIIEVTLPAMNREEITKYIKDMKSPNNGNLTSDQLIEFSMGIPILVQQLLSPGMDEETASLISAGYLREKAVVYGTGINSLDDVCSKYLQIRPSNKILESFGKLVGSHNLFQQKLFYIYQKMLEHTSGGIMEESPKFVCPESNDIYQKIFSSRKDVDAWIDIFVPNLNDQDLQRLNQAVGMDYPGSYGTYTSSEQTSRMSIFGAGYRKVNIWQKLGTGEVISDESDPYWSGSVAMYAKNYIERFQKETDILKLDNNLSSFLIHSHEHSGMIGNPMLVGWLMESMLQQKGIPYFVNNRTYGAEYVYLPQEQKIRIIKKLR
ncbi:MAG: hypothetical protein WCW14_05000 [Candidatus Paceibacterota bacterium]|jgi:hypothetical protein